MWTSSRIDLVFYELASIADDFHAEKFLGLIESNLKPPGFFTAVKTLCLPFTVTGENACGILSACTQVESLACWVDCNYDPELPLLITQLPLRRLYIEARHFSSIPLTPSTWLSSLTHISLIAWGDYPASGLSKLAHFPLLTHVALNYTRMGLEHAAVVCSSCPRLHVLVLLKEPRALKLDRQELAHDHRIVLQDGPRNLVVDWEASYFGCPDMWTHAEAAAELQKGSTKCCIER
jgi:hypothetical protein